MAVDTAPTTPNRIICPSVSLFCCINIDFDCKVKQKNENMRKIIEKQKMFVSLQ